MDEMQAVVKIQYERYELSQPKGEKMNIDNFMEPLTEGWILFCDKIAELLNSLHKYFNTMKKDVNTKKQDSRLKHYDISLTRDCYDKSKKYNTHGIEQSIRRRFPYQRRIYNRSRARR